MDKNALFMRGAARIKEFCELNKLPLPNVQKETEWYFDVCGYYRPQTIHIYLPNCATPATENQVRNWNWPGSTTDREPYGVICHELGHHVDWYVGDEKGKYWSGYSSQVMNEAMEKELTSYCPNPAEWFAEMFRLFVTNHSLLESLRPKTHAILTRRFRPVSSNNWIEELRDGVPNRILMNLKKKVLAVK